MTDVIVPERDAGDGAGPPGGVLLRVERLSKTFPGTRALSDVDLDIRAGEVHALLGHNGSGKSTLIKVLSGYHHPDPGGRLFFDGQPVPFGGGLVHGRHAGAGQISFVHQNLGLVLELNTIDNLALHGGFARTRFGRVRWREQARIARRLMEPFALDFDVTAPLSKATPVERTIVAIAAALQGWDSDGGVLVLDEPTAVLPPGEVDRLFAIVEDLRSRGAGILYVSHRLDEVFRLADRVTVLRNGSRVITRDVAGLTKSQLVHLMLGMEMEPDYRAAVPDEVRPRPLLEVRDLSGTYLRGVSFTVHEGEVLGIAGLPDSGRDELPRLLTDMRRHASGGTVRFGGDAGSWERLAGWRENTVALLPPDRAREGIIGFMSVGENLSISVLDRFGSAVRLSHEQERRFGAEWVQTLDVKTSGLDASVQTLSGGNQQKVLLGRTLARDPSVLVMCEPTAGVDIGARHAIYDLVAEQVRQGLSVMVTSSDAGDLLALCTRILVLHEGVVARDLAAKDLTEHQLVQAMEGVERETDER
jgi:ribose transport system ATP-binding protein